MLSSESYRLELLASTRAGSRKKLCVSSIIGMLEVVESDFAKNLATEETEEDNAEAQYQKMTQMNKVTSQLKSQDVSYKTKEHVALDKIAH